MTTDSQTSLRFKDCDFDPVVVMKDFLNGDKTLPSDGRTFKLSCALCKMRSDIATNYGRFCSIECRTIANFYGNGSQKSSVFKKSTNGSKAQDNRRSVSSPLQPPKPLKIKQEVLDSPGPPPSQDQHRNSQYQSDQTISVIPEIKLQSSFNHKVLTARQKCLICGTETDGKLTCDVYCGTSNMRERERHDKPTQTKQATVKCLNCKLVMCECPFSSDDTSDAESVEVATQTSPTNRNRQLDESSEDESNTMSPSSGSYADRPNLRKRKSTVFPPMCRRPCKRKTLSAPRRANGTASNIKLSSLSSEDYSRSVRRMSGNTTESEITGSEIMIENVRSVHPQNADSAQSATSNQWTASLITILREKNLIQSPAENPRFLEDPEQVIHDAKEMAANGYCRREFDDDIASSSSRSPPRQENPDDPQSSSECSSSNQTNHSCESHHRHEFHGDTTTYSMQSPGNSRISSESERSPSNRAASRSDNLNWDTTYLHSPTHKDKERFFFPENSEVYRLHCDEIKTRIAANQAKLRFFESELEKSKLEKRLLINNLNCDKRMKCNHDRQSANRGRDSQGSSSS